MAASGDDISMLQRRRRVWVWVEAVVDRVARVGAGQRAASEGRRSGRASACARRHSSAAMELWTGGGCNG
jgi:hypothetical protein